MKSIKKGVSFITGPYGVGKTTLCSQLSQELSIPSFSASELISARNDEIYGANKAVKDKVKNQDILRSAIEQKLLLYPTFLLNGHTAIFKHDHTIDVLPTEVFAQFHLTEIVLLCTTVPILLKHLNNRDSISYSIEEIDALIAAEEQQCQLIAKKLGIPLLKYNMKYDSMDYFLLKEQLLEKTECLESF